MHARSLRSNARPAEGIIGDRLASDLKGVATPIHVFVGNTQSRRSSPLLAPHRMPAWLHDDDMVDLGGGLAVLSPQATIASLAKGANRFELMLVMFEFAGLYSQFSETARSAATLNELVSQGVITSESQQAQKDHVRAYYDTRGVPVRFTDSHGKSLPWELSFDRFGRPAGLWKRPPLLTSADLVRFANGLHEAPGGRTMRAAAPHVLNGSGSPLETRAAMQLCLPVTSGGEGWSAPFLNRRIDFSPEASDLAHQDYCIADQLWADALVDLEVHGQAFHADKQNFFIATGRKPALESMGFTVIELTYEQLSNLDLYDTIVSALAKKLDVKPAKRTPAFLRRRSKLHEALYGKPF